MSIAIDRVFSSPSTSPYDQVQWKKHDVEIGHSGKVVFRQEGVEAPEFWSDNSVSIVASKYFYGQNGTTERETSVRQLIHRVANTLRKWGVEGGYFDETNGQVFYDELSYICLNQYGSFNSPVWFNVGLWHEYKAGKGGTSGGWAYNFETGQVERQVLPYLRPQGSACFIQSVTDDMDSIMALAASEAMLFKFGSGTGTDLTPIRSSKEFLSGGGRPSGPLSFLKVYDQVANVVKSGGKCLAPHQRVWTEKGPQPVKTLAESNEDFVVLSFDPPANRLKAKWARAWKSGQKRVVRVETDKGHFEVSHDHPFRLSHGEACQASSLMPGMSIFAANTLVDDYVRVGFDSSPVRASLLHRMIMQDVLGLDVQGKTVHHVDGNGLNNSLSNLELLDSQAVHAALHVSKDVERGTHPFQTHKFDVSGLNNGMCSSGDFHNDDEKVAAWKVKLGEKSKAYAAKAQRASSAQKILNSAYILINEGHDISTPETYNQAMDKVLSGGRSHESRNEAVVRHFGSHVGLLTTLAERNHRVLSVVDIGLMDVYSVEVDCPTPDDKSASSGHNYALCSGDGLQQHLAFVFNTRRAAKMNTLRDWHPDIEEFIEAKMKEEQKAHALIDSGYDGSFNGEAYSSVAFQNENLSVRVSDEFMNAAVNGKSWKTRAVTTGEVLEEKDASALLDKIAAGTWFCGDPGLQYDSAIQRWHTCAGTEPIHSTNPCCFVGGTLVDTSEGFVSMDTLEQAHKTGLPLPYAYSWDTNDKTPVLRRILKAWIAGETSSLVEVTTDKGVKVQCTPEHQFLTYSGQWIPAKDLATGTRLRKIHRVVHPSGRWQIHTKQGHHGLQDQNRFVWSQACGHIPPGYDVHHKDEDKTHDSLSNLELVERSQHKSHHAAGDHNNTFINVDDSTLLAVYEHVESNAQLRADSTYVVSPARWNKAVNALGLNGQVPLAQSRPDLGRGAARIQGMSWSDFVSKMESLKSVHNDSVTSVVSVVLDSPVKVYDIEVEDCHNFGVRNEGYGHSLVVHNSEYVFINNTACNLASLNLLKFRKEDGQFDIERFKMASRLFILAQEILVDFASYPTKMIAENSHIFRTLGLGYANLGSLIMSYGLPYDSAEGNALAGSIAALMTGEAYRMSAQIAAIKGPFAGYHDARCSHVQNPIKASNEKSMLYVIQSHAKEAYKLHKKGIKLPENLNGILNEAIDSWQSARTLGGQHGYRNAQVTVIAPTGTISFMMDCSTTGIEPDIALVNYKTLAGGGQLKIVNTTVPCALKRLGYSDSEIEKITAYILVHDTIEDVGPSHKSGLKPEHLPVFDCAFQAANGQRSLSWHAHLNVMAAVQPFISGAISKTVNMPKWATVADIRQVYVDAWKLGLKCVAVYRSESKRSQPLNTSTNKDTPGSTELNSLKAKLATLEATLAKVPTSLPTPQRRRLSDTRDAITHKFNVGGHEGYVTVGLYDDGRPGELFIQMAKEGSTMGGLMDTVGTLTSIALQYGVPLETLAEKFTNQRFEPSGFTSNKNVPRATSIIDYVFRWMKQEFPKRTSRTFDVAAPVTTAVVIESLSDIVGEESVRLKSNYRDGLCCSTCGSSNVQVTGTCATCRECGTSLGCS